MSLPKLHWILHWHQRTLPYVPWFCFYFVLSSFGSLFDLSSFCFNEFCEVKWLHVSHIFFLVIFNHLHVSSHSVSKFSNYEEQLITLSSVNICVTDSVSYLEIRIHLELPSNFLCICFVFIRYGPCGRSSRTPLIDHSVAVSITNGSGNTSFFQTGSVLPC